MKNCRLQIVDCRLKRPEGGSVPRSKSYKLKSAIALLLILILIGLPADKCGAYVEIPYALGRVITESTNIVVVRVERVDREKNLIIFRKVRDLKGTCATDQVKHNIGRGGYAPREWQNMMNWADIGQTAVFFYAGGAGEVCIESYWY